MSSLEYSILLGGACFLFGSAAGYWLWRWKERNLLVARLLQEQTTLGQARHQAETLVREARLQASEEALRIRREAELSFAAQQQLVGDAEKRLLERESLMNRQLLSVVEEAKRLQEQQQACRERAEDLDQQQGELAELARQRRQELQAVT